MDCAPPRERKSGHMSASASGIARLDDPRAEPLQLAPPTARRRRSARSRGRRRGTAACRSSPTVSPSSRGSGTGRPDSTDQSSGDVGDASAPSGRPCRATGTSGKMPSSGISPHCDFSPTVSQRGGRKPDRAAGVGARCRDRRARRRSRPRCPDDEPPVVLPGWAGLRTVPYHGFVPEHAPGELGQVGLADDGARRRRARAGRPSRARPGRGRRRSASRTSCARPAVSIRSLTSSGAPGERPVSGTAQRLVEPGDGGVVRVGAHDGITATHSTSIFAPGITSAEISTSVEAGRVSPKHLLPHRVDRAAGRSRRSGRRSP